MIDSFQESITRGGGLHGEPTIPKPDYRPVAQNAAPTEIKHSIEIRESTLGFTVNGFDMNLGGLSCLLDTLDRGDNVVIVPETGEHGKRIVFNVLPKKKKSPVLYFLEELARLIPGEPNILRPNQNHHIRVEGGRLTVRVFDGGMTKDFHLDECEIETNPNLAAQIAAVLGADRVSDD